MNYKVFNLKYNLKTILMYDGNTKVGICKIGTINKQISLWDFEILKPFRNKGYAKEFMNYLIIEHNINALRARPKENDISMKNLIKFYEKYDFKIISQHILGIEMRRKS